LIRARLLLSSLAFVTASVATTHAARADTDVLPGFIFRPGYGEESPTIGGVRAGGEDVRGEAGSYGAGVAIWAAAHDTTSFARNSLRLGGGTFGTEGAFETDMGLGGRLDITREMGPYVRGGLRGHYIGSDRLVLSLIEAPTATTGFQYLSHEDKDLPLLFEAGGRAGFAAGGRFIVEDARRVIRPALEAGVHASVGVGPVHFEGDYSYLHEHGAPSSPIEVLYGAVCVRVFSFGACVDGQQHAAEAILPDGTTRRERVVQLGLILGFWLGKD
jgi:hypothetical protein